MSITWKELREKRITAEGVLRIFRITEPQVDVLSIARSLGVDVRFEDTLECSGEVSLPCIDGETKALMLINANESRVRQRFTIAHELCHILYHNFENKKMYRDDSFVGHWKETEANRFAADLLVPFSMLAGLIRVYNFDVQLLADRFGVSYTMMDIRMEQLRSQTIMEF